MNEVVKESSRTLLAINNYHYLRGGADAIFLEEGRLLRDIGWQVVPFSMHHSKNLSSDWSSYFVEEIEFGQAYGFGEKVRKAAKSVYSFEARKKLSKLIDRVKPDMAHLHNIYHHLSPAILSVLKSRQIPSVMTLHDLKIACPAYKMLASDGICERCKGGKLFNVVANRCIKGSLALSSLVYFESLLHGMLNSYGKNIDRFIVPSRFYQQKFVEWGWPSDRFRYVPNFVDCSRYEPEYAPGKEFVYFGRLTDEKGLYTLVRAAALAKISLRIVGTGPEEDALRALAEQTQCRVSFDGYLTGAALQAAVRSARAVILPSEWYENAPVSVMEAYALGKPVIGANIGGIPELVREGETGWIFPSRSVDHLADCMRQVEDTPDSDISDFGRAGRHWMSEDFTAEHHRSRLLDIYHGIGLPRLSGVSAAVHQG